MQIYQSNIKPKNNNQLESNIKIRLDEDYNFTSGIRPMKNYQTVIMIDPICLSLL